MLLLLLLLLLFQDEERLFGDISRTKLEKDRLELNKRILSMANERDKKGDEMEGYRMPTPYEDEHGRIDRSKIFYRHICFLVWFCVNSIVVHFFDLTVSVGRKR